MSQENVEIVRAAVDAFSRGNFDGAVVAFDPDVTWEETASLGPDASNYVGITQLIGAVEKWLDMWEEYGFEVVRYEDAGDQVVLIARERGHGGVSGASVERELGGLYMLQDRKVVRVRWFGKWIEALKAAGRDMRVARGFQPILSTQVHGLATGFYGCGVSLPRDSLVTGGAVGVGGAGNKESFRRE